MILRGQNSRNRAGREAPLQQPSWRPWGFYGLIASSYTSDARGTCWSNGRKEPETLLTN